MQKLLFFASFFLLIQGTLSAQCLSQPACPPTALIFCDFTENNAHYWNDPAYYDPGASSHDLAEGMADLSMQIATSCDPAGVQVSFILILDLDGNGIRETAVTSDALPGTGLVYFGNAGNSNYTGGEARYFDSRPVPTDQKYEFALEKTVQDSVITVRVRWTTALAPTDYVWPELPGGTHRIEWRFEKDGEVKTCGYNFVVKDCQAPTVKCLHGLNINNLPNCMIHLWAVDFFLPDSLPVDNYSPANLLQFGIRRSGTGTGFPVNSPGVMFTAADLGIQPVEIWVRDLAGNADFCETYVILQDNLGSCDPFHNPDINLCAISHCGGGMISEVSFEIYGSHPGIPPIILFNSSDSTDCAYFDNSIPLASNLNISPFKDNNPLNGVTTYDLVLISRHILATEALNSPYKLIAADANKSGSVTTADIVELRKLILGVYQELPNNTSWRFVDTSFAFPNPANPFQTVFPESISIANIQANISKRFYGIKIGDVNCNAIVNVNQTPGEEALTMPNLHLQANEIVEVPIRFLQANDYYGFQFGLHFDPAKVELLAVTPAGGTTDNFSVFSDCLHVSWSDAAPALFLPDVPILHLRIKALASVQLADVFSLKTAAVFPAEAYPVVDSLLRLSLEFGTTATTAPDAARQIFDPAPNPTMAGVRIPLRLEQSERVAVELLDGTGRSLYRQEQSKAAGAQWLEVPATAFPQAGVYFWRVQVGAVSRSGKVVKQ